MIKTQIICTIGPSSWDPKIIRDMFEAGMTCARVNGAFADIEEINKVNKLVKDVSDKIELMVDIKGPEVRMNKFKNEKLIKKGDLIIIGNNDSSEIFPSNYKNLYNYLNIGQRIIIGDGDVELVLEEIQNDLMYCKVLYGNVLKPGKAMNLPNANYSSTIITNKDLENLNHAISLGWNFVSASFIENAESAKFVKKHLEGSYMKLIAKIENESGVKNIDEILDVVDGIMVARGGLGVEMGLEKVPLTQRFLINKANKSKKIVITATQMMESMIENPRPTRAEVNDVATAILLGTNAVMLSAESSMGKYPVETVDWVYRIASEIESSSF